LFDGKKRTGRKIKLKNFNQRLLYDAGSSEKQ
jgi:hypothetical protein